MSKTDDFWFDLCWFSPGSVIARAGFNTVMAVLTAGVLCNCDRPQSSGGGDTPRDRRDTGAIWLKIMDFSLKLMDFTLKIMDLMLNMMGFLLKMMDLMLKHCVYYFRLRALYSRARSKTRGDSVNSPRNTSARIRCIHSSH